MVIKVAIEKLFLQHKRLGVLSEGLIFIGCVYFFICLYVTVINSIAQFISIANCPSATLVFCAIISLTTPAIVDITLAQIIVDVGVLVKFCAITTGRIRNDVTSNIPSICDVNVINMANSTRNSTFILCALISSTTANS